MLDIPKQTACFSRDLVMNNLVANSNRIPAMTHGAIDKVRQMEALTLKMPQVDIATQHIIHGGMYARTIMIPAKTMITGALIKLATILIVQGDVVIYIGDKSMELTGYNVLPASAMRKQAFVAKTDVYLTMIFPTDAQGIKEAEEEFTDDADSLASRNMKNEITITGD